jgi:hypothetical protein
MPCGCGKKNTATIHFMGQAATDTPDPVTWGPLIWKYLHCLAEKVGSSGNIIVDNDHAVFMEILIGTLHQVIPCPECQAHASSYISQNPLPSLKGLKGDDLRNTLREWLFTFHNHVRTTKGQPIIINTLEGCKSHYAGCFMPKCEYTQIIQTVAYAVKQNWVKIDVWRKWYSTSEKIRLQLGNIIIA